MKTALTSYSASPSGPPATAAFELDRSTIPAAIRIRSPSRGRGTRLEGILHLQSHASLGLSETTWGEIGCVEVLRVREVVDEEPQCQPPRELQGQTRIGYEGIVDCDTAGRSYGRGVGPVAKVSKSQT